MSAHGLPEYPCLEDGALRALDSAGVTAVILDHDLALHHFTRAAAQQLVLDAHDLHLPIAELNAGFQDPTLPDAAQHALTCLEPTVKEVTTRDGRCLLRRSAAYRNSAGEVAGVVVCYLDVSAQKQLERQLELLNAQLECRIADRDAEVEQRTEEVKERERHLRAIVETAPDAIITITGECTIDSFNPAAERMFGYRADEVVGQHVAMLLPQAPLDMHEANLAQYVKSSRKHGPGRVHEVKGRNRAGHLFPMELSVTQIDERGLFIGITRDISEKRALEKQIVSVSTLEQERIGQEIHDGLGQQLSAITMLASSLENKFRAAGYPEAEALNALIAHLQTAAEEAHALAQGLAPVPIDPNGLASALAKLAEQIENTSNIKCKMAASQPLRIDDRTIAMQLYRIAQEAVNNAVKHADARRIDIRLLGTQQGVSLTVEDDGQGLPDDTKPASGLGMHIMRYRANAIGASLRVSRRPEGGTRVRCSLE